MREWSRQSLARDFRVEGDATALSLGFDDVRIAKRRRTFPALEFHAEVRPRLCDFDEVVCPATGQRACDRVGRRSVRSLRRHLGDARYRVVPTWHVPRFRDDGEYVR